MEIAQVHFAVCASGAGVQCHRGVQALWHQESGSRGLPVAALWRRVACRRLRAQVPVDAECPRAAEHGGTSLVTPGAFLGVAAAHVCTFLSAAGVT